MPTEELTVIVHLRPKPGHETRLLAALRDDRRHTLSGEPGCRTFAILAAENSAELVLHEIYQSAHAFASHKIQPHFAAFERAVLAHCAEEPRISVLRPVD